MFELLARIVKVIGDFFFVWGGRRGRGQEFVGLIYFFLREFSLVWCTTWLVIKPAHLMS